MYIFDTAGEPRRGKRQNSERGLEREDQWVMLTRQIEES